MSWKPTLKLRVLQNVGGLDLTAIGHAAGMGQVHTVQDHDCPASLCGDESC